jgi:hypothetical protein
MALTKGVNSYVTLKEANSYFLDRIDVAAWTSANDTQKSQALVTATSMLDNLSWIGVAVSDSQTLAFPRLGSYFDPRLGRTVELNSAVIPSRISTATYELAYHLLNNDGLLDDTGLVKNISIGEVNLTNVLSANKIPSFIRDLIAPLRVNSGANLWWRAN